MRGTNSGAGALWLVMRGWWSAQIDLSQSGTLNHVTNWRASDLNRYKTGRAVPAVLAEIIVATHTADTLSRHLSAMGCAGFNHRSPVSRRAPMHT